MGKKLKYIDPNDPDGISGYLCHAVQRNGKICKNYTYLKFEGAPLCWMHRNIAKRDGVILHVPTEKKL